MRSPGAPGVSQIPPPGQLGNGHNGDHPRGNGTDLSSIINQLDDTNGMGNTMDSFIQGSGMKLYEVYIPFFTMTLTYRMIVYCSMLKQLCIYVHVCIYAYM
jgi:hypothetical protein